MVPSREGLHTASADTVFQRPYDFSVNLNVVNETTSGKFSTLQFRPVHNRDIRTLRWQDERGQLACMLCKNTSHSFVFDGSDFMTTRGPS